MRIPLKCHFAHPPQQIHEARLSGEIAPHHQGVHAESDQPLHLPPHPIRDRCSDRHVLLPGISTQQYAKPRQQRHEQCCAVVPAQSLEVLREPLGNTERLGRSSVRLLRRTQPVRRQLQHWRQTGELLAPVTQLPLQHFSLQPVPLPLCIVRVLDEQGSQR